MSDYEYDYKRFDDIIISLMNVSWRDPDELEIGRDISDISEVNGLDEIGEIEMI